MPSAAAQSGGFVVRLGRDTMHVERFDRVGDRITGSIAARAPASRLSHYEMTVDPTGRVRHFAMRSTTGDGQPLPRPPRIGAFEFIGDSLIRTIDRDSGGPLVQRMAAPLPVFPGPWLPYTGMTFLSYELALQDARRRAVNGEGSIALLSMLPTSRTPQQTTAWFVAPDSAELDYFGRARSGWKFAADGRLIRADWTGTTFAYRIERVDVAPDVAGIAAQWAASERASAGAGAMSPRDSTSGSVGNVRVKVTYARPAQRGRRIWGDVVPWGRVWRLGADLATHVSFSGDVRIGDVPVPAGTYTLWMLPIGPGRAELIVNRQTQIFGTAYNPEHDLARIPLTSLARPAATERLTIRVSEGRLTVEWAELAWSVAMEAQ
jgi:hypothetical protein